MRIKKCGVVRERAHARKKRGAKISGPAFAALRRFSSHVHVIFSEERAEKNVWIKKKLAHAQKQRRKLRKTSEFATKTWRCESACPEKTSGGQENAACEVSLKNVCMRRSVEKEC